MPLFRLTEDLLFPPVEWALPNGLLAVGGDLSPERLLLAYRKGIFPWYEGQAILWWSPDPRFVLFPEDIRISKTMKATLRQETFTTTCDRAFREVVAGCRAPRKGEEGTWITEEMERAYCRLHEQGFAHSFEAWKDGRLAGGLYGVSQGGCFFGESMFTRVPNASKAALISSVQCLARWDFDLVDCQVYTRHLQSLGARMIPRRRFSRLLKASLEKPTRRGPWRDLLSPENPLLSGHAPPDS